MPQILCQPIPLADWPAAFAIHQEYLDSEQSLADFSILYGKYPTLYVGCYRDTELIGICFGYPFTEKRPDAKGVIVLEGIAVKDSCWNLGYGSQLLHFFENQAKAFLGYTKISVGSAANIETENFYLKNGFTPIQLCIKIAAACVPANFATLGYTFVEQRPVPGGISLYLATTTRDKQQQAQLKATFNADEVIFILEKVIVQSGNQMSTNSKTVKQ